MPIELPTLATFAHRKTPDLVLSLGLLMNVVLIVFGIIIFPMLIISDRTLSDIIILR